MFYYMSVYLIESKNIEISTPISLEVWLFCCGNCMLFPNPEWLPAKTVMENRELKFSSHDFI